MDPALPRMPREDRSSARDIQPQTLAPQIVAQAIIAGRFDDAGTCEPHLPQIRAMAADRARVRATTVQYTCIVDTLTFQSGFIEAKPGTRTVHRAPCTVHRHRHRHQAAGTAS